MSKYFWDKTKGLNSDLARHKAAEKELDLKIAELENRTDAMGKACLAAYRWAKNRLMESKAEAASKIGKK